jgi:hypothetical protein
MVGLTLSIFIDLEEMEFHVPLTKQPELYKVAGCFERSGGYSSCHPPPITAINFTVSPSEGK